LFSLQPDWHLLDRANPLVRQYLTALDAVLQVRPELLGCDVVCIHCQIRFLTDPRNAGRTNLYCPFGCREHFQRENANRRSRAYRQTLVGQEKKRILNARRYRETDKRLAQPQTLTVALNDAPLVPVVDVPVVDVPVVDVPVVDVPVVDVPVVDVPVVDVPVVDVPVKLVLGEVVLDEAGLFASPMLPYLRMIVRVVEGLELGCRELVRWLLQALRQRSIASRSRVDYVLRFLNEHPP